MTLFGAPQAAVRRPDRESDGTPRLAGPSAREPAPAPAFERRADLREERHRLVAEVPAATARAIARSTSG